MLDTHHYISDLLSIILSTILSTILLIRVLLLLSVFCISTGVLPAFAAAGKIILPVEYDGEQRGTVFEQPGQSQWCRYLLEDASVQAILLLAPTLSGEMNDEGRKEASLGFDLMNILKAGLIEDTATAKCRRYLARSALDRMAIVSAKLLDRTGYEAKATQVKNSRDALEGIRSNINNSLNNGVLDRVQAMKLLLAVDRIIVAGELAAAEAARREGLVPFDLNNLSRLADQMIRAENEVAELASDIRSTDAVSVSINSGWRDGLMSDGLQIQEDDFYASVKVSVKLGAFNPARYRHEELSTQARLHAYQSEPGSIFWSLREIEEAQLRTRSGLVEARDALLISRTAAQRLSELLPQGEPDYASQRYGTEIEIIRLDGDIASINAILNRIDHNLEELEDLRHALGG